MSSDADSEAAPSAAARWLASGRHRVIAVVLALLLLATGFVSRPQVPIAAPVEETPAPLLKQVVVQRTPPTILRTLQNTAATARRFAAQIVAETRSPVSWSDWEAVAEPAPAERHGVIVGPAEVLAAGAGLSEGERVMVTLGEGRRFDGIVAESYPHRQLALISVEGVEPLQAPARASGVMPGDAVVAVARTANSAVVAPLFVAAVSEDEVVITTPLDRFRGMSVFNGAGDLVGVVALAGGDVKVIPIDAAMRPGAPEPEPSPSLGISVQLKPPAGDAEAAAATVTGVAPGGIATRGDVRTGDELRDAQDQPVRSIEQARAVLEQAFQDGALRVRRGRRTLTLTLPRDENVTR
jgi:S1-C subfamily serine protease